VYFKAAQEAHLSQQQMFTIAPLPAIFHYSAASAEC